MIWSFGHGVRMCFAAPGVTEECWHATVQLSRLSQPVGTTGGNSWSGTSPVSLHSNRQGLCVRANRVKKNLAWMKTYVLAEMRIARLPSCVAGICFHVGQRGAQGHNVLQVLLWMHVDANHV